MILKFDKIVEENKITKKTKIQVFFCKYNYKLHYPKIEFLIHENVIITNVTNLNFK